MPADQKLVLELEKEARKLNEVRSEIEALKLKTPAGAREARIAKLEKELSALKAGVDEGSNGSDVAAGAAEPPLATPAVASESAEAKAERLYRERVQSKSLTNAARSLATDEHSARAILTLIEKGGWSVTFDQNDEAHLTFTNDEGESTTGPLAQIVRQFGLVPGGLIKSSGSGGSGGGPVNADIKTRNGVNLEKARSDFGYYKENRDAVIAARKERA